MPVGNRSSRSSLRGLSKAVAVVVTLLLAFTTLEAGGLPAVAVAPPAAEVAAAAKVESRPDLVSAAVSARSQGSRVEVEALRTTSSTTWSNPDGTLTTEAHAAAVRFKDAKGQWQDVDLTLQRGVDGVVAPRGHQTGLQLGKQNPAVGQVFASVTAGAAELGRTDLV